MLRNCLMSALALAFLAVPAASAPRAAAPIASDAKFDVKAALATSQAVIGRQVNDYAFRDSAGRPVRFSDFQGKPLAVNFIYTSCAHSCPIVTEVLAGAANTARDALGADSFHVVSVGFDVGVDTPERMRKFARQHGVDGPGWTFLSGGLPAMTGLMEELGFVSFPTPHGFDHLDQVTILDADGRVYQQVYGDRFATPNFVDPLKNLVFGTAVPFASLGELIKKVRLFCTIYDPAADRYRFDYSIFIRLIVGATIILALTVFVIRNWWRIYRRSRPGGG